MLWLIVNRMVNVKQISTKNKQIQQQKVVSFMTPPFVYTKATR